ncbi:hypothetical protein [Bosea sp. CRIB-10]|uniref:hypothetical protein n=1 Tax=Bosea sp. CRIB-10 TaxID=378404 RepID=UPI000B82632E|nr:hypothetical protein [Bosea sp. CRIB-10]
MRDKTDDITLALDAIVDAEHTARQHAAPEFLKGLCPGHEIGDAGLILQGNEEHTLGAARPLALRDGRYLEALTSNG